MQCHTKYSLDDILTMDTVPLCPKCNGIIRPDVVLYEEGLDETILNQSLHALQTADTCIVLGTSLFVGLGIGNADDGRFEVGHDNRAAHLSGGVRGNSFERVAVAQVQVHIVGADDGQGLHSLLSSGLV